MVSINGKIVSGLGAAGQTLSAQMPHFKQICSELGKCHLGTINVILECQLEILSPDFIVPPFKWSVNGSPEMFGFPKVRFEVVDAKIEMDAWIYVPYLSPHRMNPFYAEILAPKLNLNGSTNCKLHLHARKVMV